MGRVTVPFGVRGWIKVHTLTDDPESLCDYPIWRLGRSGSWREMRVVASRMQGNVLVAQLEGVDDRDAAAALRGSDVAVLRAELPEAEEGEFYWADLVGLHVYTVDAVDLGVVTGLLETGANDVLEVKGDRERLIPFVIGPYVKEVDLDAGRITVDWDPDF